MKARAKQLLTAALPRSIAVKFWSNRQYRRCLRTSLPGRQQAHGLPAELIVCLTSYPPRFPTLHLTLRSLLRQDTRPDRIVLWLAHEDEAFLPPAVRRLFGKEIELRLVDNVRSYKKLVFALQRFPAAWIATADDDVFYKPDWLTLLVQGAIPSASVIACHRAHRLMHDRTGTLSKYGEWTWDVTDAASRSPSADLMPTGVGGVLYPPAALHPDAVRRDLYEKLAPSADDLWFYWCARRVGSTYRKVGPLFEQRTWWSSQDARLFDENLSQNDEQIAGLLKRYGDPLNMYVKPAPLGSGRTGTDPAAVKS